LTRVAIRVKKLFQVDLHFEKTKMRENFFQKVCLREKQKKEHLSVENLNVFFILWVVVCLADNQ
jgi:hypothetical protein